MKSFLIRWPLRRPVPCMKFDVTVILSGKTRM